MFAWARCYPLFHRIVPGNVGGELRTTINALILTAVLTVSACGQMLQSISNNVTHGTGGASPAVVQTSPNTCFGSSVASLTCSFTNNVTAANMWIVCILSDQAAALGTPTAPGETFVALTDGVNPMANSSVSTNKFKCFSTNSAAGGGKTASFTGSGNHDPHIHMLEVSGQNASPIDCTNGIAPSATLSVSCTSTNAKDLLFAFFGNENNSRTLTVGSGYTINALTNNTSGNDSAMSEYKVVSASGSQTATAGGNSGDAVVQGIVAIKGT